MRWIIAALLAFPSTNLLAEPADSGGYVLGGLAVPWEEGATTDEYRTYLASPGGWSAGFFIGGGVRLAPFVSVEAEWHRTGIMEAIEPSRYFTTYSVRRRDTMIGLGARFHVSVAKHIVVEPLGLVEGVREQSWLAETREPPVLATNPFNQSQSAPFVDSWGRGLAGGVDVRAGGKHLALLPGFRLHRFWRDAEEDGASSTWPGGVSKWGWEITLGGRVDF